MVSDKLVQRIYENKIQPELQSGREQTLREFITKYPEITYRAIELSLKNNSQGPFTLSDSSKLVELFLELDSEGKNSLSNRISELYKKGMGVEAHRLVEIYHSKTEPLVKKVSALKTQYLAPIYSRN